MCGPSNLGAGPPISGDLGLWPRFAERSSIFSRPGNIWNFHFRISKSANFACCSMGGIIQGTNSNVYVVGHTECPRRFAFAYSSPVLMFEGRKRDVVRIFKLLLFRLAWHHVRRLYFPRLPLRQFCTQGDSNSLAYDRILPMVASCFSPRKTRSDIGFFVMVAFESCHFVLYFHK